MLWALFACNSNDFGDPGCLHRDLGDWCFHDAASDGPMDVGSAQGRCGLPTFVADVNATRCGDVDVKHAGGGFSGQEEFYDHDSGELIAVRYWTDTNTYCGGFQYWYGRRVMDCADDCSYDPASTELPVCD